jgi:hypothetical protein
MQLFLQRWWLLVLCLQWFWQSSFPGGGFSVVVFLVFSCGCFDIVVCGWFSRYLNLWYFQICWDLQDSSSLVDLYCAGCDWFSSGRVLLWCLVAAVSVLSSSWWWWFLVFGVSVVAACGWLPRCNLILWLFSNILIFAGFFISGLPLLRWWRRVILESCQSLPHRVIYWMLKASHFCFEIGS